MEELVPEALRLFITTAKLVLLRSTTDNNTSSGFHQVSQLKRVRERKNIGLLIREGTKPLKGK